MKRLVWICVVLVGCSGPIALDRAIKTQHREELSAITALAPGDPKTAWFKWNRRERGLSLDEVLASDRALSATKNPFDARREADAVSRGALIFEANCARCHGRDVRGNGPDMLAAHPCKDFHSFGKRFAATLHGGAPRSWFQKISHGHGPDVEQPAGYGRAMPAFEDKLAREQIWLVITYLQSLDIYAEPARETDPSKTDED